jgi:hypothetical protein
MVAKGEIKTRDNYSEQETKYTWKMVHQAYKAKVPTSLINKDNNLYKFGLPLFAIYPLFWLFVDVVEPPTNKTSSYTLPNEVFSLFLWSGDKEIGAVGLKAIRILQDDSIDIVVVVVVDIDRDKTLC